MNTSDSSASSSAPGTHGDEPPTRPVRSSDKVDEFFDSVRRAGVVRAQDRWVGGVASGVALRLGVDALLVRAAFVVLFLLSGFGLVLYALGWAFLPEQADGRIHVQEALRGRFSSALAGAGIVFVVGANVGPVFGGWGGNGSWLGAMFWVSLTVFVVYVLVTYRTRRTAQPQFYSGPGTQGTPGAPGAPGAAAAPGAAGDASTTAAAETVHGPSLQKHGPVDQGWGHPSPGQAWSGQAGQAEQAWQARSHATPGSPGDGSSGPGTAWEWDGKRAVTPRRSTSAGIAYVGAVLGLSLLTFASLLVLDRYGDLAYSPWLTAAGVCIVLAGLAIVVAGVRGRSSGGLSFLAIVAIIISAPAASWSSDGGFLDGANRSSVGSSTFAPTTVEEASDGYSFGLGEITLDLTTLDLPPADDRPVTVPVEIGAGSVTVVLAEGTSASAEVTLGAGQVYWQVDDADTMLGGVGTDSADLETDDVRDGATPDIHLVIKAGAGEIFIKEES
ncbi:PspC domain-containing protein [Sanguibacter antarcticus]|uniref:Phage shock protein C (PspC) family protein n=1 Tax=Sanguibacter antarcticus TaxID=372484 RepID=A0A2A9E6S1_9MICO|nr:PspC domain-containing protein [Sanguibacter antarcticus]PFG33932.1 phage shock protein C (PspC) family protein [Sanguibacter antarcticus]